MRTLRLVPIAVVILAYPTGIFAQPVFKLPPGAKGCQKLDLSCEISGTINSKDNAEKQAAEKAQNMAKNNFCLSGDPTTVTFDTLKQLQTVANEKQIVFGKKGPTPDRSTLKSLIASPDGGRLGEGKLVQLTAFVFEARQENAESVNCEVKNKPASNDIHISLTAEQFPLPTKGSPENDPSRLKECLGAVAEMSPHFRPKSWTPQLVNKIADEKLPVRVTGHLFFDSSHEPCDVSGAEPVASAGNPKRMSLWEIHPIYNFEVCTSGKTLEACSAASAKWATLEKWAASEGAPLTKKGKK
jgi:hypothetical protein